MDAAEYNKCVRCGLCLPSCPTYLETLTETSGPRGRISLIRAFDEGRLAPDAPEFVRQMSECLDCRACAAACPSGVDYGVLVEHARERIETHAAQERPFFRRLLQHFAIVTIFEHLGLLRFLAVLLRIYQRSPLPALLHKSGILRAMGLNDAERLSPPISRRFFRAKDQRYESPAQRRTVALHAGCVMSVAFAEVHEATVRVLQRNGSTVVVPRGQGCCGALAIHAGEAEAARRLMRRTIAAFEASSAEWYVVNAAGCGSALKEAGRLFADDPLWSDRASRFAARVRDVTELLGETLSNTRLGPLGAAVTYQDPCHLANAQGITAAPRRLLQLIPGIRFTEAAEPGICCGSAGIYNLTQPEMARRLGERKARVLEQTAAAVVATANPGCAMQLRVHTHAHGAPRIAHVVELLDESYRAYSEATSRSRSSSAASVEE